MIKKDYIKQDYIDGRSLPGKRSSGSPCERTAGAEDSRNARRIVYLAGYNRLQVSSLTAILRVVDRGGKSEM